MMRVETATCYHPRVDTSDRSTLLAECKCGRLFWTMKQFRELLYDSTVRIDDQIKWELRTCECGQLLRVRVDRDGRPVSMLKPEN